MAERYTHTLPKLGMGKGPDVYVVVQAAVTPEYGGDADEWGRMKLAAWQSVMLTRSWLRHTVTDGGGGTTEAEWWKWLAEHVPAGLGRVWLVTLGAVESAAILGLWQLVEDGTACIGAAAANPAKVDSHGSDRHRDGVLVLSGPPTIIQFGLAGRAGSLTWIDPQNYHCGDLACQSRFTGLCKPAPSWVGEPHLVPESVSAQCSAVAEWLDGYLATISSLELGAIELTVATQAMSGFRRSYLTEPVTIHDSPAVIGLERQSLFGGRCECRKIGRVSGPVYHLDVNALYPSVAMCLNVPVRLECVTRFPNVDTVLSASKSVPCVARVYVDTPTPAIPYRWRFGPNKDDVRIVYPTGSFWTTLTAPELQLAAECGRIVKCTTLAVYAGRPIYRTWVEEIYAARLRARERGDASAETVCKALLNSSFGKWAQVESYWRDEPDEFCPWPWYQWQTSAGEDFETGERGPRTNENATDAIVAWRSVGGRVQRQVTGGEPAETFPAITAHIHAAGRVALWRVLQGIGLEHIYYYDTDSVWVDAVGYYIAMAAEKIHESRLGALKVVARHDSVHFHGLKRYVADGNAVMAGGQVSGGMTTESSAPVIKAPPMSHYLFHRRRPGCDRVIAQVRMTLPYLHGREQPDGSVLPLRMVDGIADAESYLPPPAPPPPREKSVGRTETLIP